MYQVYSNLYDSLIQDTPTVDAPTGTTEASGTGTGTPVEETLYQQEARLFDEVVDEE
jgi:hypothetical protein